MNFIDGNFDPATTMTGVYDPVLILVSVLIAWFGSFAALEMVDRVKESAGRFTKKIWLAAGAGAMGSSVWAMHFIGMLAFDMSIPVGYDALITGLSIIPAVFSSAVVLHVFSLERPKRLELLIGGLLMGAGVGTMHYTGMAAMRMNAVLRYDPVLFGLSIIVAVILAVLALHTKSILRERDSCERAIICNGISSLVMGLAVAGMHYTAMEASFYFPSTASALASDIEFLDSSFLAILVAGVTVLVVVIGNIGSSIGRRLEMVSILEKEVSERSEAEKSLRDSQSRFESIVELAGDGIITLDQNHRIIVFNASAERIFGVGRDVVMGGPLDCLLPECVIGRHRALVSEFSKNGSKTKYMNERDVVTGRRANGEQFLMEASLFQTDTAKGKELSVMVRDVTQRKLSEDALRKSEARLKAVIDNTPVSLSLKDAEGRYMLVNKRFEEWKGVSAEQMLGKRIDEVTFSNRNADEVIPIENEIIETGKLHEGEASYLDADGNRHDHLVIKFPIKLDNDEFFGIGTVAIEVTERNRAEELAHRQLENALLNEKKQNAIQREFVSMVSHEFRTPLSIIDGSAQRIARHLDKVTPEELTKRTSKIRDAVVRMTGLIERVLEQASVDAGTTQLEGESLDLGALVQQICLRQQEISEGHAISVGVSDITAPVWGDPKLLDQVFTNLISNAVKYSPDDRRVEIKGFMETDFVAVVSICDHGVGIPENEVSKLFTRYFRASTSSGIAGTGIGLSLVKELIGMHDGRVDVESMEGKGSTFSVRLPVVIH